MAQRYPQYVIPVALTIAGSDPSGGAGIQADLKTFHQFGVYGEAVITLLTVQNTLGVRRVETLPPDLVLEQLEAVIEDIRPAAAKTGALGSAEVIRALAKRFPFPLVVDPVLASKNGAALADSAIRELAPHASLVTPNLDEAAFLTGSAVETVADMRRAASALRAMGAESVLVKGGHLEGDRAVDVLLTAEGYTELDTPRAATAHTHGTGCTYSAAITALLACGLTIPAAVARAKSFVTEAIRTAPGLGSGRGPLNHWAL